MAKRKKSTNPFHISYLPTWLLLALIRIVSFLPYPLMMRLAQLLGWVARLFLRMRRHVVGVNLSMCYPDMPEPERAELTERVLMNTGIGAMEALYSWWASDKQVLSRCDYQGLELLDAAKAEGRGVILLGIHFTTLDFCGRALAQTYPIDTMYKTQTNAAIDYCLKRARLRRYQHVLEKSEMRRLLKHLKQQHVIWYACDQDFGRKNSVYAPLFGQPVATLATLGRLLKMTNAKPLMVKHSRHSAAGIGQSRYTIEIFDPFTEQPLGDDDQRNAELINLALEQAINSSTDQYFWVHRRFKRRPDGLPNPYR